MGGDALVRHDELLRGAIEANGGVIVSEMGDGMAAAFPSAAGAVTAALESQRLLEGEPWARLLG